MTVEDGVRIGGFGSAVLDLAQRRGLAAKCAALAALPDELIGHAARSSLLRRYGLDAEGIAATVRGVRARSGG